MFERLLSTLVILIVLSVSGCSQASSSKTDAKPSNTPAQVAAPTNSKITLNQDAMGTTNDPSQLSAALKSVIKSRHEQHTFKPGTIDVETTTYIKAAPDTSIDEVTKIIDVIKEAGSLDVLLPVAISAKPSRFPNPLTLVISIGQLEFDTRTIDGGIELIHGPTVPRADKDTLPKEFVVVSVPKDGEYVVDDKPFTKVTLANELKPRINKVQVKTVYVLLDADNGVRYRSLAEVAEAAFNAGATDLYLVTLSDKQNPN